MSYVLEVDRLTKRIGDRTIVQDISFNIKKGEIFGLLGPNGAGKTTTIRMLVGLAGPTQGTVKICGYDIQSNHRKAMEQVGTIVENPELYPYLSGHENLRQFARLSGGVDESKIKEIVEIVGLSDRIEEKVRRYSLGMRQRLGLGQALLHNPSLLILDEPTNGLDPNGIREFRQLLQTIAERGAGILISSHMLSEIEQVCHRVGVIHQGKWIETATVADLRQRAQGHSVVIQVDNAGQALECLKERLPELEVQIGPEGEIICGNPDPVLNPILQALIQGGVQIKRISEKSGTLEDVFLEMTGGISNG